MLTYRQAYDKIIEAYFKDEINIMDNKFCFCEFNNMENALFSVFVNMDVSLDVEKNKKRIPNYEDLLFSGMCAALDVLKEIHRSRGEDVDDSLQLTKRELINV